MKSFLKKILPVAVMAFLRKIVLKNQSRRGKRFTDGTVYYGMQSENYEPHIMKLLRELSLTHNTFVNFGANTGYYPTILQVLQGLKNTILNTKSTFLVEIPCREFMPKNEFNPAFRDNFKLMFESGYGARICRDDGSFYELSLEIIEGFINENRYEGMMVLFEKALTNTDLTENG